jgi:hypothetical protein
VDDWRQDLADFAAVVSPDTDLDEIFKAEMCDPSAAAGSKPVVTALLERALAIKATDTQAARTAASGYAAMGAEELAHIFLVARHLKTLSLQTDALPPLRAHTVCWWAAARETEERLALYRQIAPAQTSGTDIDADHFAIVRAAPLLAGIKSLLAADSTERIGAGESTDVWENEVR